MTSERFRKNAIRAVQDANPGMTYQQAADLYAKAETAAASMLNGDATINLTDVQPGGERKTHSSTTIPVPEGVTMLPELTVPIQHAIAAGDPRITPALAREIATAPVDKQLAYLHHQYDIAFDGAEDALAASYESYNGDRAVRALVSSTLDGWTVTIGYGPGEAPLAANAVPGAVAGIDPDESLVNRVIAEAGWLRNEPWYEADDYPFAPLEDGMVVFVDRAESVPAALARMEAIFQPNHPDRPCRCSGGCKHGTPCPGETDDRQPCPGRLVHADRTPYGSVLLVDVTKWTDEYLCHRGGDPDGIEFDDLGEGDYAIHGAEADVQLPQLPWGELSEVPFGNGGQTSQAIRVYNGARHPQFHTELDHDSGPFFEDEYDEEEDDGYEEEEVDGEYEGFQARVPGGFEAMAGTGGVMGLLGVAMQIPQVSIDLGEVLRAHGGDWAAAAQNTDMLRTWREAEGETRACLLLSFAWNSRRGDLPGGAGVHPHARGYAEELHKYAARFTEGQQAFLGERFPAMPLPGQAGALASTMGFDRDDWRITLETVLMLLAAAPHDDAEPEPEPDSDGMDLPRLFAAGGDELAQDSLDAAEAMIRALHRGDGAEAQQLVDAHGDHDRGKWNRALLLGFVEYFRIVCDLPQGADARQIRPLLGTPVDGQMIRQRTAEHTGVEMSADDVRKVNDAVYPAHDAACELLELYVADVPAYRARVEKVIEAGRMPYVMLLGVLASAIEAAASGREHQR